MAYFKRFQMIIETIHNRNIKNEFASNFAMIYNLIALFLL